MGLRPDEISKVILRDLDLDRGEINVRTSKLGLDRTLRLRPETRDLLKDYICIFGITQVNQRLFPSAKTIRNRWRFYRDRAFTKFKDPELLKIRLYDLRHWFGTMTYVKTRDLLFTKYLYPFEITSILIIAALVGAIVLVKKKEKEFENSEDIERKLKNLRVRKPRKTVQKRGIFNWF